MASIIKTLLQTHKAEIQQQDEWKQTSRVKSLERDRYQKFGDQFLQIIIQLLSDEEQIEDLTPVKLAKIRSLLLNKVSQKHNSKENVIERALGLFIRDSFEKYDQFRKIKQELEIFYEDIELQDSEIVEDDDEITIQDTVYSSSSNLPSSIHAPKSMASDFSYIDKWDSDIQAGKDKHQQIIQYLQKLSSPASQLTYLCQNFGWKSSYDSRQTNDGQSLTTAVVFFEYKDIKKELRESAVAQNKKYARMFASFKMVKKIYLSFPVLWQVFISVKKVKGIQMPSTDISTSILNSSKILHEKVEILKPEIQKVTVSSFESQLACYLAQISSFKSELNILIQQLPNYFQPPRMQKKQVNNLWKVTGSIDFQPQKGLVTKYEQYDMCPSSKVGEQTVAKKLVTKIYKNNPNILEVISMIKSKKGIKT